MLSHCALCRNYIIAGTSTDPVGLSVVSDLDLTTSYT